MSQTPTTRRQLREKEASGTSSENGKSSASKSKIKMRTRLSTGTLSMNGTSTVKERITRTPSSTPGSASSKPQKDSTPISTKRKFSSAEPSAPPPKQRKTTKSDGSANDSFCWVCHKEDSNINCQLCPRGWHLKCLMVASVPSDWVCGECEKIMVAECMDTRSIAMKQISTDTLCLLLRYALDRMCQPGSEVFQKPVVAADLPMYSEIVVNPMDFSTLEKNIKKKEYGCTEAFLADATWIFHNCVIFNGLHHQLSTVARNVIKSCKHEMSEIEVCPQCYKHSCVTTDWFIQPCDPPHPLVWAKLKGYPFWPAKAMKKVNGCVDVRFFGAHDKSIVPQANVFLLSKETPFPMRNKRGGFADAMSEMDRYIKLIRRVHGKFNYAPAHTPYKGTDTIASKRFKLATHSRHTVKGKETEKVSAISKTASAVKSKYSSIANKKLSTSMLPKLNQVVQKGSPQTSQPESVAFGGAAKKAIQDALSDCGKTGISKSPFVNPTVTVMDIIHSKTRRHKEQVTEDTLTDSDGSEIIVDELVDETDVILDDDEDEIENKAEDKIEDEAKLKKDEAMVKEKQEEANVTEKKNEDNAEVITEKGGDKTQDIGDKDKNQTEIIANKTNHEAEILESKNETEREVLVDNNEKDIEVTTDKDKEQEKTELFGNGTESTVCQGDRHKERTTETTSKSKGKELPSEGETQTTVPVCNNENSETGKDKHGGEDKERKTETDETTVTETNNMTPSENDVSSGNKTLVVRTGLHTISSVQLVTASDSVREGEDQLRNDQDGNQEQVNYGMASEISLSSSKETVKKGKTLVKTLGATPVEAEKSDQAEGPDNTPVDADCDTGADKPIDVNNTGTVIKLNESTKISLPDELSMSSKQSSKQLSTKVSKGLDTNTELPSTSSTEASWPESVRTEISPKSGAEYKDSLLQTIEACKDKLGIADIQDVEEPMDVIDDDDDNRDTAHSTKDGSSKDKGSSVAVHGKSCSDSQGDPKVSSKLELESECNSKNNTDIRSETVPSVGETQLESSSCRSQDKSESQHGRTCGQEDSETRSTSLQNDSDLPANSTRDALIDKQSELVTESSRSSETQAVPSDKTVLQEHYGSCASSDSGDLTKSSESPTSELNLSQRNSDSFTSIKPLIVDDPENSNTTVVSVVSASVSDSPKQMSCSVSDVSETLEIQDSLSKTGGAAEQPVSSVTSVERRSNPEDLLTSSKQSVPSQSLVSHSSDKIMKVTPKTHTKISSGSSQSTPITIIDDDEPSLLMEVETEDDLVIDLDAEECLDNSECEPNKTFDKTKSSTLVKHLVPNPEVLKPLSKHNLHKLSKNSKPGHLKKKLKNPMFVKSLQSMTTLPISAWMVPSEPCDMVISDVRSLSGTQHIWEDDSNRQPTSSPTAQQSQSQHLQQAQQVLQQATPETVQHTQQPLQPEQAQKLSNISNSRISSELSSPQLNMSTVEASEGNVSCASSDKQVVGVEEESETTDRLSSNQTSQNLTPAAISLINKYSQQIIGNTQLQLAEMSKELLSSFSDEIGNERQISNLREQLQWTHEQQLAEIQHNHRLTVAEMKACWEAEKSKALADLKKKMKAEQEDAVAEAKKKQWCSNCWKEALYYCCWNTSYCSYDCQQKHWTQHQTECRQELDISCTTSTPTLPTPPAAVVSMKPDKPLHTGNAGNKVVIGPTQRYNIQNSSGAGISGVQLSDLWRNQLAPNIQIIPNQQVQPVATQLLSHPQGSQSSPQQLQYLQTVRPNPPANLQPNPHIQMLSQRPQGGVSMGPNTMVVPFLPSSTPTSLTPSQAVYNPALQSVWKRFFPSKKM